MLAVVTHTEGLLKVAGVDRYHKHVVIAGDEARQRRGY